MAPRHNALAPGHEIHWFRIEDVLGQGGFGITYLARDRNLDTDVALKEYFPSAWAVRLPDGAVAASGPEHEEDFTWGLDRFVKEGRILVRFDHPSFVRVMSVFEANRTAYLVMRFETGASFREVLKHVDGLAEQDIKDLLQPLLDGLRVMHASGVIHRDIKPDNIFIRSDGSPLLLDFGAARQTRGGKSQDLTTMGTAGYAPVEQYSNDEGRQGPWTDIYALGATAYRAAAGRPPTDSIARANAIASGMGDTLLPLADQARGEYSRGFIAAIERAIAFRAQDRPQSVDEFASELGIALGPSRAAPVVDPDAPTVKVSSPSGAAASREPATTKLVDPNLIDTSQWEIDGLQRAGDLPEEGPAPRMERIEPTRKTTVLLTELDSEPEPETASPEPQADHPVDAYRAAIGPSRQDYYVARILPARRRSGVSWNWAAALFTSAWLAYRKLYLWAFAIYPIVAAATLAAAWWMAGIVFATEPRAQAGVLGAWLVGLSLVAGVLGNPIYAGRVRTLVARSLRLGLDPPEQRRWLRRKGGTNGTLATIYVVSVLVVLGAGGWLGWRMLAGPGGGA